jgi:acetyltransferase
MARVKRKPEMVPTTDATRLDRASDLLPGDRPGLDAIFAPKRVAVIGATEQPGSVGRTITWNLLTNPFGGTVFPVNPKRSSVLGIKAYPDLVSLPERIDLAVIVTPAPTVPGVIAECVQAGVKGAIVVSAGFKEVGAPGAELERQVLVEARRGRMRIIGPNCLGVMNPQTGLNATFASAMARAGRVAFISQSGALCTAVLDWSLEENVGFSAFVSVGSMLDVDWGDLIQYLGDDPRTQSILIYMETIGNARSFLSAAREVALSKPIIVIKPGRTEGGARAAASHTGALAGSDDVLEAAFRRSGVLRVATIGELFSMAEALGKQPRPRGSRLTIVTNAGGPAVIATDALILGGGRLAELSPETLGKLDAFLPPAWSHANPIDVLGDADPERYARAVDIAAADPGSDGLLVVLTPQAMTDPTQTAERLRPLAQGSGKPLLASWMGGADVAAGEAILNRASIPTFPYPDTAARAWNYMWRYAGNLRALYETPMVAGEERRADRDAASALLGAVSAANRSLLTETESKRLLEAYGIPTVPTRVARTADEAVDAAVALGFPVVVKLHSETITHKTDVGGVKLDVRDADGVRVAWREIQASVTEKAGGDHFGGVAVQPMVRVDGYELIVGSTVDPQFGPVLLFGAGGQLVEVLQDRALALPPLNTTLARRVMERTRIWTALGGVRGRPPVDLAALTDLLVRVSQLVVEQPRIRELDLNPVIATPDRVVALDARVVLHGPDVPADALPRPAIRPYPREYVTTWRTRDGSTLTFRPIRPEDEPLLVAFHQTLSEQSVYFRYLHPIALAQRVSHERLSRVCFVDYDRQLVLVAERAAAGPERAAAGAEPAVAGAPATAPGRAHRAAGRGQGAGAGGQAATAAGAEPAAAAREILGVGRLSRLPWKDEAEFALLVSDRFQRQGLGSELLRRLLAVAKSERLRRVVGFISPENQPMLQIARRLGFKLQRPKDDPTMVEATIEL